MDRVTAVFTPTEMGRIYKSMIEHPQSETLWGMSIAIVRNSEKSTWPPQVEEGKPPTTEKYLQLEKGLPLGCSKRGGLPHFPPHFEWPMTHRFGAQFKCRDVAYVTLNLMLCCSNKDFPG